MKRYSRHQRYTIALCQRISILLFTVVLAAGFGVGLAFFARPAASAVEKRDLTAFPAFTLERFWNGQYFADLNTWYADTYPGRETLIAAENKIKSLYGINTGEKVYGTSKTADEIPPLAESGTENSVNQRTIRTEIPDATVMAEDIQNQIMDGLLVKDGKVYSAYYFDSDTASYYTNVVNETAARVADQMQVYSILIPNGSGALLDEDTLSRFGGSDQKQAIDYYYSLMSDQVQTINTIDTLRKHLDEQIYYNTDHHWTSLGAYYVYQNFCAAKGIEPKALEDFQTVSCSPFYGSYYTELQDDSLIADTVTGYIPDSTNITTIYYNSSEEKLPLSLENSSYNGYVFDNVNEFNEYGQYLRFTNGDQPLMEIDNPELQDGSVCVVVKDSFGNCFVPFLVDHYDKIYVLDFRKVDKNIIEFCQSVNASDLILINALGILNPSVASLYDYLLLQ